MIQIKTAGLRRDVQTRYGADTDSVLAEAGIDAEQRATLRANGVIA